MAVESVGLQSTFGHSAAGVGDAAERIRWVLLVLNVQPFHKDPITETEDTIWLSNIAMEDPL